MSKTNKKMYKCTAVSNATWNSLYSVCCTDGLTYDADERQCCANGKCEHTCPEPRVWSTSLKSCECPSGREENDRGDCCDYSEHADGSICCPENKHNENGTCVCDDGYIPDGTGCKLPNCGGYDVTDTSKYDTNCYVCEACADDSKKFRCTESIKSGYKLDGSKCVKKQSCADYSLVSESACDTSKNTFTASKTDDYGEKCGTCESKPTCPEGFEKSVPCATDKGFTLFENPSFPGCFACQCRSQGIIDGKCTSCAAEGYTTTVKEGMICEICPLNEHQGKNCVSRCPDGTYETQSECIEHVPTNWCGSDKYTGACKKGSVSGCWKPLGTMSSMARFDCENGTCRLSFCKATDVSTNGYWGSACVQDVQSTGHTWKGYSESTGFNYTAHNGGLSDCRVTTSQDKSCTRSTTYTQTCHAQKIIGKSQYELDDGKF
ncbi:MAG: hypothetical protein Q4D80_05920 [Pseudomonadota bacterium]|nr:hypothetical protein [Pseudomonadota bacterium]